MSGTVRNSVFVSYPHADKGYLDKFRSIIESDIRNERISYWDDDEISTGEKWREKIFASLDSACVAVLFVTPNFLKSTFIMTEELPRILEAQKDGLTVIWIPIYGTFYGKDAPPELAPITETQAAFDAGKPLADFDDDSQIKLLIDICKQIDRILNPNRIPCNLPFVTLAKLFKGRDDDLAKLDDHLRKIGPGINTQPQMINGLAGIGKTRLALEYAWKHQHDFKALLFVSANTLDDLERNLAALSRPDCLDLREFNTSDQNEQRDAVIRWLQKNRDWLLILDNVDTDESVKAVKQLIAKLHGGQIIITSRITQWGRGLESHTLDVLSKDAAVEFLVESAHSWREGKEDDYKAASELAEILGYLPLALTHTTAYMEYNYKSFRDYIDDFEARFKNILDYHDHLAIEYETEFMDSENAPSTDHTTDIKRVIKTISTTFFMSFEQLSTRAKAILQSTSFLAPEPIPIAMYIECPKSVDKIEDLWCFHSDDTKSGQNTSDAINDLARYSLITRRFNYFTVHRLEQKILRARLESDRVPKWSEKTREILTSYAPDETSESPRTWHIWDILRPHTEVLVTEFINDDRIDPDFDLIHSLGCLYFGKRLFNLSCELDKKAVNVIRRTDGPESKNMASKLLAFGESLRELDKPDEALKVFKESLEIRKKLYGDNSPEMASILNYIGLAYIDQNDKGQAEHHYRESIKIYSSLDEKTDRSDYSKTLNNLANLEWNAGNFDEAEKHYRKAADLTRDSDKRQIKPQLAIICRIQLAMLLVERDKITDAEILFHEVLDLLKSFPEDHPFREIVLIGYAKCLRNTHRLTEAKRQFSTAITTQRSGWEAEEANDQPRPNLRTKLRIVESNISLNALCDEKSLEEFQKQFRETEQAEWQSVRLIGLTVLDSLNLSLDFIINTGTEDSDKNNTDTVQMLIQLFLTSISVDEANQWASADGEMPAELRSTRMGTDLLQHGETLKKLAMVALHPDTPSGKCFLEDISEVTAHPEYSRYLNLKLWITPENATVYTGEPVIEIVKIHKNYDSHVCILDAPMNVYWEWETSTDLEGDPDKRADLAKILDKAFKKHILPLIENELSGGKLFGSLRQINNSMLLALWFKEHYKTHKNIARYLETGNPEQLSPSIRSDGMPYQNISSEESILSISTSKCMDASIVSNINKAINLNNEALVLRKKGCFEQAEKLLRQALSIDENERGNSVPKIAHRLNNLCSVLVLVGNLDEAKNKLSRAWEIKVKTGHDITSLRILWIRYIIAILERSAVVIYLGQIKTLLTGEPLGDYADVVRSWDIMYFLDYLTDKLPSANLKLLCTLVTVFNNPDSLEDLDEFNEWATQPSIALEFPWES